jgi:hypothetical protein
MTMNIIKNTYYTISADTKFHSDAPFTGIDVVFKSKAQIEELIEGLRRLLAEPPPIEIVELEDDSWTGNKGLSAPVYFHAPGFVRDELDLRCLESAADLILRYQKEREEHSGEG